jgi:1-deoxy-D-xylulose-5-phosphate synthase
MENALEQAKNFGAPVLVHVITEKGRGHAPAINDAAEKFHAVGIVSPETGMPVAKNAPNWTSVFSDEICEIGAKRSDVVAITAAMLGPTGLDKFAEKFPKRAFDVGIAEQHAATSAAGLAFTGLHPVVAIYSTFLNRAFDQLLLDVGLHKAGVTFVLDRAGITGDDGPSHHGIWDLALTGIIPNAFVAAPRDGARLKESLAEAVAISDAPSIIRFPKGAIGKDLPAFERRGGLDVLYRGESSDILLVSIGAMAPLAIDAAAQAFREGVGVTVIDPLWVKPLPADSLLAMALRFKRVVVLEDGLKHGGIASTLSELFRENDLDMPIHSIGVPLEFIQHSKRAEILQDIGITSQSISRQLVGWASLNVKQEGMQLAADENADRKPLH